MKDIFTVIVDVFGKLDDISGGLSYSKKISILETVAKVRSCVVMLDLECDDLILQMFKHFLKSIRSPFILTSSNYPSCLFNLSYIVIKVPLLQMFFVIIDINSAHGKLVSATWSFCPKT
ncbi:hypothetical protein KSP40_PGU021415 [Platanthera guangdongensis]|uniref:Uncharacterized protein n=1 Tax=Platanthera guangdongensis TaxID=2320717 RepID=A0ABR2MNQ3_9ASPA